ncbi:MAG: helix-turn-helix transcriptional regulator [Pseudomonadota bacterium]
MVEPSDSDTHHETKIKKPNPIDIHVGSRLRLRRMMVGLSQEKLGEHLGLTFQQIQKYEKGTNRIGASRLYQLSQILDIPVHFFFEEISLKEKEGVGVPQGFEDSAGENHVLEFLSSREGLELNRAFSQLKDPKVRRRVIDLVRALASEKEES